MPLTPLLSINAVLLLIASGIYAWRIAPRVRLNRFFALMCGASALGSLGQALSFTASSPLLAEHALRLSWLGWAFFPVLAFELAMQLTANRWWPRQRWLRRLAYLLAVTFFLQSLRDVIGVAGFHRAHGIFVPDASYTLWDYAYEVFQYSLEVIALTVIGVWGFTSSQRRQQRQALVIISVAAICIAIDVFHYFGVSHGELSAWWALEPVLFIGSLLFAIVRYQFATPTLKLAAEQIANYVRNLVILTDSHGIILHINAYGQQLLDMPADRWTGHAVSELVDPADAPTVTTFIAPDAGGTAPSSDVTLVTPGGQRIPIALSCAPLVDQFSDVIGFLMTAVDLRQQKRLEDEIRERLDTEHALLQAQENLEAQVRERTADLSAEIAARQHAQTSLETQYQFLQELIDTIPNPVFCRDIDDRLVVCNHAFATFAGQQRETIINQPFESFTEPAWYAQIKQTDAELRTHGGSLQYEMVQQTDNGTSRVYVIHKALLQAHPQHPPMIVGVIVDITQQRASEDALRESEAHYRRIFETIQDVYFSMAWDGTLQIVSPSVRTVTGYAPEALLGQSAETFDINPHRFSELLAALRRDGTVQDFEATIERRDRKIATIAINAHIVWDDTGNPTGIEGVMRDITARKETENALRKNQDLLARAQHIARIGSWEMDLRTKVARWSDELFRLFHFTPEDFTPTFDAILSYIPEEDRARVHDTIEQTIITGGTYQLQHRILTREGDVKVVQAHGDLLFDEQGQPIILYGTALDITERKAAEQAIIDSEARFRRIVDNFPGVIWMIRPNIVPVYLSEKVYDLTGYTAEEFLDGRVDFRRLVLSDDLPHIRQAQQTAIEQHTQYAVEYRLRHRDESLRWLLEIGQAIFDEQGQMQFLEGLLLDVTDHKEAEALVMQYQTALRTMALELNLTQEHERRRLAVDLHDQICQPLVLANMRLQALRQQCELQTTSQAVSDVIASLEQLIQLSYSLTFALSPPVLHELGFAAAVEWLAEQVQRQHGLRVHVDYMAAHPPLDEEMRISLFRMLQEILSNVVKHAHAQQVAIAVLYTNGEFQIDVTDDGLGIEADSAPSHSGGGFGLFSIRERLNFFSGRLEIESAPGQGTCVSLIVPLSALQQSTEVEYEHTHLPG